MSQKIIFKEDKGIYRFGDISNKYISSVSFKLDIESKTLILSGLYVPLNSTKQGIGTKLLNAVEDFAIKQGMKTIQGISAPAATEFYKKKGYSISVKIIDDVYESGSWCEFSKHL